MPSQAQISDLMELQGFIVSSLPAPPRTATN
jgi:hypothetical protein